MNRFKTICALCATLFVSLSSFAAVLTDYPLPEWSDYEITFDDPEGQWKAYSPNSTNVGFQSTKEPKEVGTTFTLNATVTVDEDATLCFENSRNTYFSLTVTVDGEEVADYNRWDLENDHYRFIELQAGTHSITWNMTNVTTTSSKAGLYNIGVMRTPTISVNLLEPGSLGTELLYNIDRLQDVRKLKIKGDMNADDWEKIAMIKEKLLYLDMSETNITEISNECFKNVAFLHTIVLPEGLTSIGKDAFDGTPLVNVNFPSTLTELGGGAFNGTCLKEAIINEACLNWTKSTHALSGYHAQFDGCSSLRNVKLPSGLTYISSAAFRACRQLDVQLHEGIKEIKSSAFRGCYNMHPVLPSTLTTIRGDAFYETNRLGDIKEELVIPDAVTTIGSSAFTSTKYTSAVLPVSYCVATSICLPTTVTSVKLKSPTVVTHDSKIVSTDYADLTLIVPDYLVNAYKLDKNWYNFGLIEGFSTEEVAKWTIANDLVLDAHARLLGTPSLTITADGSLKINGTDGMPLNDLTIYCNRNTPAYGRIFSNAAGVTVAGSLVVNEYMVKNKWYYLSMPYNVKVGDIANEDGAKKAVRYYDGANRAENGVGGNWKDYSDDDIIPAGTGFILQSNANGWWSFPSQEDESKQYMTSSRVFAKCLAANTSETASDHGWNFVGNPYQCWYNIHKLNFTAPITVRNERSNKYEAYSIIDDDYALAPNQAFFVQCPVGVTEISFPLNGRQMTSEITSQTASKPYFNATTSVSGRAIVDLSLADGKYSDRTRVVLNPAASLGYEVSCDASKFPGDAGQLQLYSLGADGTQYAINERPAKDGEVQLGVIIPADGTYTFSLLRNSAGSVSLRDNESGETVDMTVGEYAFHAAAGSYDNRFVLVFQPSETTGVEEVSAGCASQPVASYNLAGQQVGAGYKGVVIRNGKKITIK